MQYQNLEADLNTVIENVKNTYIAEGHRVSSIKELQVYVKPEDRCAYYVINGNNAGKVSL